MKLTLGTVQFGVKYGISNAYGVPSDEELDAIFAVASKAGVELLDTAQAYGNAEERLGVLAEDKFRFVTKFPGVGSGRELEDMLSGSLSRLKTDSVYGYLAHNADFLIDRPELWETLQKSKEQGKVAKIGYSLYSPEQLEKLLNLNCIPDLVQLPYSLLDRKFEKQLTVLKQLGTEIHVRSVFLQGLYFMNPEALPEKLLPMKTALEQLKQLCHQAGVSVGDAALNYVIENPNIDQLVIGVETAQQLQANLESMANWKTNSELFSSIETIEIKDKALLNPVNW